MTSNHILTTKVQMFLQCQNSWVYVIELTSSTLYPVFAEVSSKSALNS